MRFRIKTIIFSAALAGLFMLLTFAAMPARAAAPAQINFQGKLTDPTGKAITSAVPMVFKLYTAATGGTAAWQETQTVTPDDYGIYSVLLGAVTPFTINFSTAYWLGVAVGADTEMTPRYQLVSSAYSIYSINSGTAAWATGADWSGIANKPSFATGDVTLASTQTFTGQNTFKGMITVSSDVAVAGTVTASLAGAASLNVLKAGDTMSGVLNMGGNKVTNLAAPTAGTDASNKTYVDGKIQSGILDSTNTFTGQNIFSKGVFFDSIIQSTAGAVPGNARGAHAVDLQTDRTVITHVASGQYSVISGGTDNMASGYGTIVAGGWSNTASNFYAIVAGGDNNTASNYNATVLGGESNTASQQDSIVAGGQLNTASGPQSIVAGGQENTASGQFSSVAGGFQNTAKGLYSFAAGYASSSTVQGDFTWADSEGTPVVNNVSDRTWFKNRGGFIISNTAVAANAAFAVDASGQVGIGTITPGAKLEVAGQIKITGGSPAAGKVLTSDAAGLASWGSTFGNISLLNNAARSIAVQQVPTGTAGQVLTISAGNTTSGSTAESGGDLVLQAGAGDNQSVAFVHGGDIHIRSGANLRDTNPFGPYNGTTIVNGGSVILETGGANSTFAERMRITEPGNVGIGTTAPQATLDINGFMRMARNSSQPLACDAAHDGAVALTNTTKWKICVCDGAATAWKFISDGTACAW